MVQVLQLLRQALHSPESAKLPFMQAVQVSASAAQEVHLESVQSRTQEPSTAVKPVTQVVQTSESEQTSQLESSHVSLQVPADVPVSTRV